MVVCCHLLSFGVIWWSFGGHSVDIRLLIQWLHDDYLVTDSYLLLFVEIYSHLLIQLLPYTIAIRYHKLLPFHFDTI